MARGRYVGRFWRWNDLEAPNSKHQAPENNQNPSSNPVCREIIGGWSFSGPWRLVLGLFFQVSRKYLIMSNMQMQKANPRLGFTFFQ